MKTRKSMLTGLLLALLLAFTLAAPTLAQAGRGHHGHHNHHHGHHHGHHHLGGGHSYIYSQPHGYYRPYYPQPQYNYNYYPAPVYGLPPQMMMGIGTGNTSFMIRF
jgi:hypothetical protein